GPKFACVIAVGVRSLFGKYMGQKLFLGPLIRPRRRPLLYRQRLLPDDRDSRRELTHDGIGIKVFPAHLLDPHRPAACGRQASEAVHVFVALADPADIPAALLVMQAAAYGPSGPGRLRAKLQARHQAVGFRPALAGAALTYCGLDGCSGEGGRHDQAALGSLAWSHLRIRLILVTKLVTQTLGSADGAVVSIYQGKVLCMTEFLLISMGSLAS